MINPDSLYWWGTWEVHKHTFSLSLTDPHTHTHTLAISWSQGLPFSQSGLNTALLAHRIMPSPLLPLKRRGGLKKNSIHISASTLLRQRNGPPTRVCKWKSLCYKWICLLTGKSVDYWNHRSCWTRTELLSTQKNVVGDFYWLPQKKHHANLKIMTKYLISGWTIPLRKHCHSPARMLPLTKRLRFARGSRPFVKHIVDHLCKV